MHISTADPFLGFTGCNATLQWDMSNSSYEQEHTALRIIGNDGGVIATKESDQCMNGPLHVYLSLNESLVYLEENITFKVKCSASCFPACIYRWESFYINVDNEELVILNFNNILSGEYTCTATNRETGVTAKSYPLVLHAKGLSMYLLCAGLVIVAVCLIVVGAFIFVTHRNKYNSTRLVNEPCGGPTNRKITEAFLRLEKRDRPLPIPAVSDSLHRIPRRSWYIKRNRKSISLHSFVNHDQTLWRPVRQSLSLQSLIQLSNEIGRRPNSDDSLCKPYRSTKARRFSTGISETGIKPEKLYSKVQRNKKVGYNEQNADAISSGMSNVRPQSSAHDQEEMYSTIDETGLSEYDYVRVNYQVEYIQETQGNTDAGIYEYDYAFLPHL
ncbi:hypothetical protein ACJMK2_026341 [Sinanodonta woodiana]|uniref:Ig-like domain-containing protein n=1 Tax=Sinanodonta woodiana TaxID=1069815 RepID=A0ABD3XMS3_SINWO